MLSESSRRWTSWRVVLVGAASRQEGVNATRRTTAGEKCIVAGSREEGRSKREENEEDWSTLLGEDQPRWESQAAEIRGEKKQQPGARWVGCSGVKSVFLDVEGVVLSMAGGGRASGISYMQSMRGRHLSPSHLFLWAARMLYLEIDGAG